MLLPTSRDNVVSYIDTLSEAELAELDALEREHLGDPDLKTGIYHPDNVARSESPEEYTG